MCIEKIFKTLFEKKAASFYFVKCIKFHQGQRSLTKDHYVKFGDIFQESTKQKN